jgi:hypothetical protein
LLAAALASRDGCGGDPKPAGGSGSGSGSSVATPTLAPAVAPVPAGSAAPTTTTMTKDAQAKLDKLVGAKPGSHKPIKPTPEPPPPKSTDAGSGAGSAAAKPAKKKNQFPYDGREMSENEMFSYPDMDRSKESYDYGATVRQGFSSVPHYVAYRCVTQPTCHGWTQMGEDWKAIGWWGAVM